MSGKWTSLTVLLTTADIIMLGNSGILTKYYSTCMYLWRFSASAMGIAGRQESS